MNAHVITLGDIVTFDDTDYLLAQFAMRGPTKMHVQVPGSSGSQNRDYGLAVDLDLSSLSPQQILEIREWNKGMPSLSSESNAKDYSPVFIRRFGSTGVALRMTNGNTYFLPISDVDGLLIDWLPTITTTDKENNTMELTITTVTITNATPATAAVLASIFFGIDADITFQQTDEEPMMPQELETEPELPVEEEPEVQYLTGSVVPSLAKTGRPYRVFQYAIRDLLDGSRVLHIQGYGDRVNRSYGVAADIPWSQIPEDAQARLMAVEADRESLATDRTDYRPILIREQYGYAKVQLPCEGGNRNGYHSFTLPLGDALSAAFEQWS